MGIVNIPATIDHSLLEMARFFDSLAYSDSANSLESLIDENASRLQNPSLIVRQWLRKLTPLLDEESNFLSDAWRAMKSCDDQREQAYTLNPNNYTMTINLVCLPIRRIAVELFQSHPEIRNKIHISLIDTLAEELGVES